MQAKIVVEFTIKNICHPEDLTGRVNTLDKMVRYLIKEEGLFGIVSDKYKILKITQVRNNGKK
jgi:hypothetical protein